MKTKILITIMIVFFATCNLTFGQDLKPLKSFDNDVEKYLEYNFVKDNVLFKGNSFENFINSIEAEFLMADIHISIDRTFFILRLNLQPYENLTNDSVSSRVKKFTGVKISFEDNEILTKANQRMIDVFAEKIQGTGLRMTLNSENMDKLKGVLNGLKINSVTCETYLMVLHD